METQSFLRSVLGTDGLYCILGLKVKEPNLVRKQKFFPTIEQAVEAAEALDDQKFNAYFALATFEEGGGRKAEDAIEMRSLFIDLDCGPGKDYTDQPSALRALRDFVKTLNLPKPLMVSSGYGIHAYWPLTKPVPVNEWKPVAQALKRTCVKNDLFIDPAVPADVARVLRVPGTHNYKNGGRAKVEVLGTGAADKHPLSYYADVFGAEEPEPEVGKKLFDNVTMGVEDDPVMQRLKQSRKNSFKLILQKTMEGRGCEHIRQMVLDQAGTEEPIWRGGLSIAAFCEDGEKAAHIISHEHPEYDADETVRKMQVIKGPYTCEKFNDLRPGVCANCPLFEKIRSPIVLGADFAEAETEEVVAEDGEVKVVYKDGTPDLPRGYKLGAGGTINKTEKDEEGKTVHVPIYLNKFYYTARVVDPEAGECIVGRLHLPNDGVREFTVPLVAATSKEELRKALSKHGLTVSSKGWDNIMAYTQAWIEKLQEEDTADTARTQFGWSDDSFTSYVIGDREIFADRVEYNPPSSKTSYMFPYLKKKGTLEGWVEQAKFFDRDGLEPYQFVICQALAAPLMRLTPVHAAIFDFYSDGSGHGKTTTQNFAATIYGEPGQLVMGAKDTLNSRLNRMELMKDVNIQMDEFTEFPAEDTSDLIYGITSGRQKARMASGSNEERFRGQPWSTTVTSSSNYSMLAKVYASKSNPQAEVQRVLRYHVQPHNFTDKNETDVFSKGVGEHQGHAIEVFVQLMMSDMVMVRALLDNVQRKIDTACGLTMQNRFWSVQAAVTITALVLAREAGLLSYDVKKLMHWTIELISANRRASLEAQSTIESIITEYVAEHYGEMLWIKGSQGDGTDNGNGLDNLVVPDMLPRGKLMGRYETDTKLLYLVLTPFKKWCTKRRLNADSAIKEAVAKFSGRRTKMRICRGTKLRLPSVDVLELDCSNLDLGVTNGGSEGR